jgi:hypothetical protein
VVEATFATVRYHDHVGRERPVTVNVSGVGGKVDRRSKAIEAQAFANAAASKFPLSAIVPAVPR